MAQRHRQAIFSIAAGLPFLKVLADCLLDGRLVDGFRFDPDNPLALADATIYVPTRRAARALRSEIVDRLGGRAAILPVIRPLGETEEDGDWLDDLAGDDDEKPPIGTLERLLELANLILAWRNRLPDALRDLHGGSPLVAPASPADAIWLARHLVEIIDSMETEEADWSALARIDDADHALWWQLSGEFLAIASAFWPERLAELGRASPAAHRNAVLAREARRIETGAGAAARGPVIVAGSTGSMPATARLIAAIAGAERGAVVLPGLDLEMSDDEFRQAGGILADGTLDPAPASRSHPQYGLFHLLSRLKVLRTDVVALGVDDPATALRRAVLSHAMLPSEATAGWHGWRSTLDAERLSAAFSSVSLIEARNERAEATAIAIALKQAVTTRPGEPRRQAALITPDRNLARRVGLELQRFGIAADDSAGTPLLSSPQGSLVHLLLEAVLRPGDPVALAGLIKHPLVRFGLSDDDRARAVTALELTALRGGTAEADPALLLAAIDATLSVWATDRHPPAWRLALSAESIEAARDLASQITTAIEPLSAAIIRSDPAGRALTARRSLSDWAERTALCLESLCTDARGSLETLWSGEAGDQLAGLLGSLIDSRSPVEADGTQWIDVMTALMAGEGVRPRLIEHPRVFIWGGLEARLQTVDTIILGGLNEGMWPASATANPFLSRMMKTAIGLEPPERRIGQAAHDFVMAASQRHVVLTRSAREGSAPTVPSRFLQRLLAVVGDGVARDMAARGQAIADLVERLDERPATIAPGRPAPRPPAELQPKRYSFSEVGRLRRDPYQIHARRILRLDPVAPFNRDPGPAERGTIYHRIVERFIAEGLPADGAQALPSMLALADRIFDEARLPDHVDAVWRPRFASVARSFLAFEALRRRGIVRCLVEVGAKFTLPGSDIVLTGIADRIDLLADGRADIIDYKTGSSPSLKEARSLLDPQLPLEAAALSEGAFKGVDGCEARDLIYVRLKPGDKFEEETVNHQPGDRPKKGEAQTAAMLAERSAGEFVKLVTALERGQYGFASRLVPKSARDVTGDYDHLARVAEWSVAEDAEDGNDGD